jgi:TRAP-type C4-dicarboxylate transport system permease small subunit
MTALSDTIEADSSDRSGILKGSMMNALKIVALALIAAGILGLMYGGFTYTKDTHEAKIGPIEMAVKEKETVNVPVWAGVGAIVVGAALLLVGGRKT